MSLNLHLKDVVHHGVEAVACIALATWATSAFSSACIGYAAAKITYIGSRTLLDAYAPQLTKGTKRNISWLAGLVTGIGSLQVSANNINGKSMDTLTATATTLLVIGAGTGIRYLCDKSFKRLNS